MVRKETKATFLWTLFVAASNPYVGHSLVAPNQRRLFQSQKLQQQQQQQRLPFYLHSISGTTKLNLSTNSNQGKTDADAPSVEVSPSNHGTTPLQSLLDVTALDQHAGIRSKLQENNWIHPTPIQANAIPLIQAKYDVMASAQTGSGKTLMFSLPLICDLLSQQSQSFNNNNNKQQHQALIISPTRELAIQTANVLETLVKNKTRNNSRKNTIKVALATGGAPVAKQRQDLQGASIIVGTPGRILQFIDERTTLPNLSSSLQYTIIDEADRCLDLGFEPQLKRIARAINRRGNTNSNEQDRQTILCSATFPVEVQRVASEFLKPDYYFVAVGRIGATHSNIEQRLIFVNDNNNNKRQWNNNNNARNDNNNNNNNPLYNMVVKEIQQFQQKHQSKNKNNEKPRIIIFTNTKEEADNLGKVIQQQLKQERLKSKVVHGDISQNLRNTALQQFRNGDIQVLVATDVAARGLDISGIGLVIQAQVPRDIDTYVHRIGRTGRAGATGEAISFISGRSVNLAPNIVQLMTEADQNVPSWLVGMSYITKAKEELEQDAILAGGGVVGDGSSASGSSTIDSTSSNNSEKDEQYSGQDFRSTAAAGSWGSERDTSYHSFDDEAYSSLDAAAIAEAAAAAAAEAESSSNDQDIEMEEEKEEDASETFTSDGDDDDDSSLDNDDNIVFERPKMSKALRDALKQQTGSFEIGDEPDQNVYNNLYKNRNKVLPYEYLAMFPFEKASPMLSSKLSRNYGNTNQGNLPQVLMVAEKPSIAKAIADALSGPEGPRERRGISRALPVYEFTSKAFNPGGNSDNKGQRYRIKVTSVVGHVFSLGFVEPKDDDDDDDDNNNNYRKRQKFTDPQDYFHLPVVKQEEGSTGKLRVVDHLKALAGNCDHLVLWLDCDAEGENIAHEVISITRKVFDQKTIAEQQETNIQDISALTRRIHRARFSAISKDALIDAFRNLEEPDAALSRSVDARQELDLRVGVAMTRLLNWRCVGFARQKFAPETKLVSYGPCQTPALSFCVDRAREIEDFVPQPYWKANIKVQFPGTKEQIDLRWSVPEDSAVETKLPSKRRRKKGKNDDIDNDQAPTKRFEPSATYDQASAQSIINVTSKGKSLATISKVEKIHETINPPVGLNTVALLSAGSKALGMSPKQVMSVAEKLYSAGFISYPRTETTKYDPKGFDVRTVLQQHISHPEWGKTAGYLLRTKYSKSGRPPSRGHDTGDHPPITSLKSATREQVGGGQAWRVYEFVTRTFLGSLGDELKFTRTVAEVSIDDAKFDFDRVKVDNVGFAGACSWVLKDIGANNNNKKDNNNNKDNDVFVDLIKKGTKLNIIKSELEKCATKPPRFLQEHELIELMDQNRIGTDASMATHVTNIVDRGYVTLCDETGVPLRPPRPPRPGQKPLPRQIGRYMVPSSLGIGLIDLFEKTQNNNKLLPNGTTTITITESPALLSQPKIRAKMEAEVNQIAQGLLEKDECLDTNLAWFERRYVEFHSSLSQRRLQDFAHTLVPVREGLYKWKRLGAFELPKNNNNNNNNNNSNNKSSTRKFNKNNPKGQKGNKQRNAKKGTFARGANRTFSTSSSSSKNNGQRRRQQKQKQQSKGFVKGQRKSKQHQT